MPPKEETKPPERWYATVRAQCPRCHTRFIAEIPLTDTRVKCPRRGCRGWARMPPPEPEPPEPRLEEG